MGFAATVTVAAVCFYTPVDDISYLFSLYEQAPMLDSSGHFRWKDEVAAKREHMDTKTFAIGGMNEKFRHALARAFRAMEVAGLDPTINSGYRSDYRQGIIRGGGASAPGYSFHGGTRVGGWGKGLAADIVSKKASGATLKERLLASRPIWDWLDKYGTYYGIGRAYGDRDPPHVTPVWSKEYLAHHGGSYKKSAKRHKKKLGRIARQ